MRRRPWLWPALSLLACFGPTAVDPEHAGPDFAVQGEYVSAALGAQVAALGRGRFHAVFLPGGLPGAGWNGRDRTGVAGSLDAGVARFEGAYRGEIQGGRFTGRAPDGSAFSMPRVERRSPTLGQAPPPGAIRLDARELPGEWDEEGRLSVPATTARSFGGFRLHLEFRTPFMPRAGGQLRGNSGVYLQGRYEIQVLDSFGLAAADNGCGAIYAQRAPDLNLSFPPLSWQTYDIEFQPARFGADGARTAPARVSVRHNGVPIHDAVEIAGPTGRGRDEGPEPGPILLQDHWNPVAYRNLWIVPEPE